MTKVLRNNDHSSHSRKGKNGMLDSNLPQQHIVIVGDGSLFDDGITTLLAQRTNLLISHTIFSDEVAFLNMIKRDQPSVIMMCESHWLDTEQVIDSILIDPVLIGLCIFVVRLGNPMIDIYERSTLKAGRVSSRPRSIIVRTANDFIDILSENIR